ncbi:chemotaxis protein [Shewanella sp. UCD-FRSSP16_17]|uniref:methyl-accepting chemotaxis protein n=1 Tax=Shewanella sp. UCD-FRSSP16_17 TaxID=1853256 RepID=UPI0007EEED26|nr:methyl-accepting chemotaxis protein [Shewanella sp. UCD-FRSSP16_17]OBT11734.1 chemotaxis protein [Shewanella sp. UCD-FRSSP16_17]
MKEVKFRWIDQFLIKLTIKAKFTILAMVPILLILLLTIALTTSFKTTLAEAEIYEAIALNNNYNHAVEVALDLLNEEQKQTFLSNINGNSSAVNVSSLGHQAQQMARQGGGSIETAAGFEVLSNINNHDIVITTLIPHSNIEEKAGKNNSLAYALTAVIIIIILLFSYYISTFIGGALYTTVMALRRAADGDLSSRLNFFEVPDEFSLLAISVDTLVDRQHKLVLQMSQATEQIRQVVQSFRATAEDGQTVAVNQRQHLDSLATAMEEMTAAVKEVARNAEQSSSETQEANNQVTAGSEDIATTVQAIDLLSTEIADASDAVNVLNDNASKIDAVVTTINAISEQTNLLALNAAIEAARAGEQGRGFAVVADEVRTLAGRTQSATVEIKTMIEALQSGSQNLTQVMSRTVEQAEEGKKHVLQTGEDLASIAHHSGKVFEMSVLIATSAEEQSAVANEIASNLMEIRNQSHNVEEAANMSVSGCDELNRTAEALDKLMIGLKV